MADYTRLRTPATELDEILIILRRHNFPWLEERLAGPDCVPAHRETMPGSAAFETKLLKDVYRTPLLYRLAFLRQLSTVALATHLEATHTRLSHALGTAEMASRMLERIKSHTGLKSVSSLDPLAEKACLFYCFIHDAFHGPMGHSLDIMRDAFGISLDQKVDDSQFDHAMRMARANPADPIGAQLRLAASRVAPGQVEELLEMVSALMDPAELLHARSHLYFLRDIVSSTLDADRLDYLIRDAAILTDTHLEQRFQKLAGGVTAVEEDGIARLAYPYEHRDIVAEALTTRRELYARFYEHPDKLILDDMLCYGVYYVLAEKGLTGALDGQVALPDEDKREQVIREFLLLTDADVFPALGEFRAAPGAYDLLTRILQRRYFVAIDDHGISYADVERILGSVADLMDIVSSKATELAEARSKGAAKPRPYRAVAKPQDAAAFKAATDDFFTNRPDENQILFFAFQKLCGGSFLDRIKLERAAWKHFCEHYDTNGDLRIRYLTEDSSSAFASLTGDQEKESLLSALRSGLDRYPPLHLSMSSSSFKVDSRDDVEWYTKEGAPEEPVLFWKYSDTGEIVGVRERVEARVEHAKPQFPVLVAVPPALANIAKPQLLLAIHEVLRSFEWFWGRLARGDLELPVPQ